MQLAFFPDSRRLLSVTDSSQSEVWNLSAATLTPRLERLAQVLASRPAGSGGELAPLPPGPNGGREAASAPAGGGQYAPRVECWYGMQAARAMDSGRWSAAQLDLDRLVRLCRWDRQAAAMKALVDPRLCRWNDVAAYAGAMPGRSGCIVLQAARFRPAAWTGAGDRIRVCGAALSNGLAFRGHASACVLHPAPASRLTALVGPDGRASPPGARASFAAEVGDRKLFQSPFIGGADQPARVDVDLRGATAVMLKTLQEGDGVLSGWGQASIRLMDGRVLRLCDLPVYAIGEL